MDAVAQLLAKLLEQEQSRSAMMDRMIQLATRALEMQHAAAARAGPTPKLTSREHRILEAIGTGTLTTEQIASKLHLEPTGSFKETLAVLTRFCVLTNGGAGYAVAEQFRHLAGSDSDA